MQTNKEKSEELPMEEFENDNQEFRDEFLKKFNKEGGKEKPIEKSNTWEKWL